MNSDNEANNASEHPNDEPSNTTSNTQFDSSPNVAPNQNESSYIEQHRRKVSEWKEYGKIL